MADDELSAALAEIRECQRQAVTEIAPEELAPDGVTELAETYAPRLLAALDAALRFHERTALYGNAATDDEPGACPHHPDSPLHFEDGDGSGEWLCEGKPEGAACSTCTEDGLPVAFPCAEYSAILAALTGKGNDGGGPH
jgi:hypothetical protein